MANDLLTPHMLRDPEEDRAIDRISTLGGGGPGVNVPDVLTRDPTLPAYMKHGGTNKGAAHRAKKKKISKGTDLLLETTKSGPAELLGLAAGALSLGSYGMGTRPGGSPETLKSHVYDAVEAGRNIIPGGQEMVEDQRAAYDAAVESGIQPLNAFGLEAFSPDFLGGFGKVAKAAKLGIEAISGTQAILPPFMRMIHGTDPAAGNEALQKVRQMFAGEIKPTDFRPSSPHTGQYTEAAVAQTFEAETDRVSNLVGLHNDTFNREIHIPGFRVPVQTDYGDLMHQAGAMSDFMYRGADDPMRASDSRTEIHNIANNMLSMLGGNSIHVPFSPSVRLNQRTAVTNYATSIGADPALVEARVADKLRDFAQFFENRPAYNGPQKWMKDAAKAISEENFEEATNILSHIASQSGRENWWNHDFYTVRQNAAGELMDISKLPQDIKPKFIAGQGGLGSEGQVVDMINTDEYGFVKTMRPQEFHELAAEAEWDNIYHTQRVYRMRNTMQNEEDLGMQMLRVKVDRDGNLRVTGHEGRGRAMATIEQGGDEINVGVIVDEYDIDSNRLNTRNMGAEFGDRPFLPESWGLNPGQPGHSIGNRSRAYQNSAFRPQGNLAKRQHELDNLIEEETIQVAMPRGESERAMATPAIEGKTFNPAGGQTSKTGSVDLGLITFKNEAHAARSATMADHIRNSWGRDEIMAHWQANGLDMDEINDVVREIMAAPPGNVGFEHSKEGLFFALQKKANDNPMGRNNIPSDQFIDEAFLRMSHKNFGDFRVVEGTRQKLKGTGHMVGTDAYEQFKPRRIVK